MLLNVVNPTLFEYFVLAKRPNTTVSFYEYVSSVCIVKAMFLNIYADWVSGVKDKDQVNLLANI